MTSLQSFQAMIAGLSTVDKMEHLVCDITGKDIERARHVAQDFADRCIAKVPEHASYINRMWLDAYYGYMYEFIMGTLFHSWKTTWF